MAFIVGIGHASKAVHCGFVQWMFIVDVFHLLLLVSICPWLFTMDACN